jgi:hypothetical protein
LPTTFINTSYSRSVIIAKTTAPSTLPQKPITDAAVAVYRSKTHLNITFPATYKSLIWSLFT